MITLVGPDGAELDQIRTPLVRLGDERQDWEAPALAVLLDVAAAPTLQPDGTREIDRRRSSGASSARGTSSLPTPSSG